MSKLTPQQSIELTIRTAQLIKATAQLIGTGDLTMALMQTADVGVQFHALAAYVGKLDGTDRCDELKRSKDDG